MLKRFKDDTDPEVQKTFQVDQKTSFRIEKVCKAQFEITEKSLSFQSVKRIKAHTYTFRESVLGVHSEKLKTFMRKMRPAKTIKKLNVLCQIDNTLTNLRLFRLTECLKYLTKLQDLHFDFSYCGGITCQGLQYLGKILKKFHSLKHLNLDFSICSDISVAGFPILGKALKGLASLQRVKINFAAWDLINVFQRRVLKRRRSPISKEDEGPQNIPKNLKRCHSLQSLRLSFISDVLITDERLLGFGQALKKLASLQEICLDFSYCENVTNFGLLSLCEGLEKLELLRYIHLDFEGCYNVTNEGILKAKYYLNMLPSLKTLDISRDPEKKCQKRLD